MNFLGHLFFSDNDHRLMHANLFGDFVKGKDLSKYPEIVQEGITLHRTIDSYIDHHPAIIELLHVLYEPLPKVAGIAVDLYFDHILAKRWNEYHPQPLNEFIDAFYEAPMEDRDYFNERYLFMIEKMKEKNWLYQYQFKHGLFKACHGVSNRISFPNVLNTAHSVFDDYEPQIIKAFEIYMEEAKIKFNRSED